MKTIFLLFFVFIFCTITAQDTIYEKKITAVVQKAYQYAYTNKDSANFYLDKAFLIANKNNDWESSFNILSASNRSASYFYDLERMSKNIFQLDSLYKLHEKKIDQSKDKLFINNSLLFDKGIYYNELGDYNEARKNFQKIIESVEKLSDSSLNSYHIELLQNSYLYVANMYSFENKLDLAKQYYLKNIRFISEQKEINKRLLNGSYTLLAGVYNKEKQYQISNNYYKKSLNYNINNNGSTNSILASSFNIANNYADLKQNDSANYYLDLAKTKLSLDHAFWHKYYKAKAYLHSKNNNYILAEKAYQKSIQLIKQKWKGKKNIEIGQAYISFGEFEMQNMHPNNALVYFNEAQNQLSQKKQISSALQNTVLFESHKNKANIFNALKNHKQSLQAVNQSVIILDSLKPTFKNKTDKLLLIENAFTIFETGLEATYNLYPETNNTKYIDTAFYYSEKSKSILLLEALLGSKASSFGKVPMQLLEKEKQLKSKITQLEKTINKNKTVNNTTNEELFLLKKQYRIFIKDLETTFPAYYNLKYNTQVVTIPKVQEMLNKDQILISYFYGNKAIYAISISKNNTNFEQINIDSTFTNTIKTVYKKLSNPKSDVNLLAKDTYSIYKKLVKPLVHSQAEKQLIIITDGLLNYLPFSSLNTQEKSIQYLVEDYSISYVSSASLLSQLNNKPELNNLNNSVNLLAYAPSFSKQVDSVISNKLLALPNNKKEISLISSYFEGTYLSSEKASLNHFKKESSKHNIIHLATHAILNDENPEFSYLAFSPSKEEEYLLYVSDLYNLQLQASLVTLSACESGIGDIKRGEGFISLANGFFYSGAESVANTLWKINDNSSSLIMESFYKYLKKGDNKSKALQKAKKEFLNNQSQNALSHPYYWSSFIISGNVKPIVVDKNIMWVYLGCFVFIPLLFLVFRKKR